MEKRYEHLGIYSDWVSVAKKQSRLYKAIKPGRSTIKNLRKILGFTKSKEKPLDVIVENTWEKDGVIGEQISWWTGYGPRTQAWLFRPIEIKRPLPGILALHDHGGFKFYGKEKIAIGNEAPHPSLIQHMKSAYDGRAYANELSRRGYIVLVHDTFLWGSRKFPPQAIPPSDWENGMRYAASLRESGTEIDEVTIYNAVSGFHEHTVEKYCNLLGTTLAGVVSHEDRIALNYLATRTDICTGQLGCIGLSGGGNRAALLLATSDSVQAAVIVGLMSTYEALLDHNVISHTWMLFPQGWAKHGDWPDVAACRAPMPLFVQYNNEDELFTLDGMEAAHKLISNQYYQMNSPDAYQGKFYPGYHKFDLEMQEEAFHWLDSKLKSNTG